MFNFTCRFFDYIIYDSNNNAKTQYYTECIRNDIRIRPIYKTHAEHGYWNDIVNEKQWLEKTSTRDAIKCDSTSWRGEGTWNYLPSNPSPPGRNLPPRASSPNTIEPQLLPSNSDFVTFNNWYIKTDRSCFNNSKQVLWISFNCDVKNMAYGGIPNFLLSKKVIVSLWWNKTDSYVNYAF